MRALVFAIVLCLASGCPRPSDPKKSFTRLELAKSFLQQNQLDNSEAEAKKALKFDPNNHEAHNVLGLLDLVRARNTYRLLETDDCVTGIEADSLRSEFEEQLTAAAKHFEAALAVDPEYAEAMANHAVVKMQLEDFPGAITLMNRALELPNRLDNVALVRTNLGWAQFESGHHVDALKNLRRSNQFQPGMCVTNYRLGRVYFAREEWDKALQFFNDVISKPECPIQEAYYYAMKTHQHIGNASEASKLASQCTRLQPKSCVASKCASEGK